MNYCQSHLVPRTFSRLVLFVMYDVYDALARQPGPHVRVRSFVMRRTEMKWLLRARRRRVSVFVSREHKRRTTTDARAYTRWKCRASFFGFLSFRSRPLHVLRTDSTTDRSVPYVRERVPTHTLADFFHVKRKQYLSVSNRGEKKRNNIRELRSGLAHECTR